MNSAKQNGKKQSVCPDSQRLQERRMRRLVALVGVLSLCFVSILYGMNQTKRLNSKSSPRRIDKVGDNFERVLKVTRASRVTLILVMGQAVYNLEHRDKAIVIIPKKTELLRKKKYWNRRA